MRKLLFLVVAVVAGLAVTPAMALGSRSRPSDPKLQTLYARFVMLRHIRPSKPPAEATSGAAGDGLEPTWAVAQKLPDGGSLWLIPGTKETCLALVDPAASYARTSLSESCQENAEVLKHGAYVFISSTTHEYIFGVQPGNAHTITATTSDGRKMVAKTRYGVYMLVSRRPKFVRTLSTPGGATAVTVPDWG